MLPWLGQILPPVWSTLTTSADKYVREVVNSEADENCDDENDEVSTFCSSYHKKCLFYKLLRLLMNCWKVLGRK